MHARLSNTWTIASLAGVVAIATAGCGGMTGTRVEAAAAPAGTPVVVGCAPNQRAIVHPAVVNGIAMSQVECVAASPAVDASAVTESEADVTPTAVTPLARTAAEDAHVVPVAYAPRAAVVQVPRARTAARVRSPQRSWQKSAAIIGGSAGVGAGLGAAMGGKKGALIGAALGGGAATVWDQITRRK